jgi:hypothetical protein
MERLGEDIRRELGRFGPAAGMEELVREWPAAVGEEIARNAWPARIGRDGTLHVAVSSSAWVFELTQLASEIVSRLKTLLGDEAPPRLRFAPGQLPELGVETVPNVEQAPLEPTEADRSKAARIAAPIENPALREAVAKAAAASLARAAADRSF